MSDDWQRDLSDSAKDFLNIVWPEIKKPFFGDGELLPVESVKNSEMARDLDILAGIDAWQIQKDKGRMRGIATRVQWGWLYPTFTIRAWRNSQAGESTEYKKRLEQIKSGWLYPAITVQAYLKEKRKGPLRYCCAVRTSDLYKAVTENPKIARSQNNSEDGNIFLYVQVRDLKLLGIRVLVYPEELSDIVM